MPVKQAAKPEEAEAPKENPRAVIGGNRPPLDEEARATFREELLRDRPDFEFKVDEIVAAADRVAITDEDSYARAGDFIRRCRAAEQHIDQAHKIAKGPYLEAGRAVDAAKNEMQFRVIEAKGKAQDKANAYAAKIAAEEKAERERAEREAREAAAAAREAGEDEVVELAAAQARKAQPVRSDAGTTISAKSVWNSRVTDYARAFKAVKSDPKVKEAIDAAIARQVRAGIRELPGVEIWETKQAVAR